jgi:hypothetical protein
MIVKAEKTALCKFCFNTTNLKVFFQKHSVFLSTKNTTLEELNLRIKY